MTAPDAHGRTDPPAAADEVTTLLGFLDFQRATFAWKCADLDADGLAWTVGVSTMTLGGMLKHLALTDVDWTVGRLLGRDVGPPWDAVDWDDDPDWEWHSAAHDPPDELRALWRDSVVRSRAAIAEALDAGGPDALARRSGSDGHRPSVRWVLVHLIEEYARHNGHADLIRESVDGSVGE